MQVGEGVKAVWFWQLQDKLIPFASAVLPAIESGYVQVKKMYAYMYVCLLMRAYVRVCLMLMTRVIRLVM